MKSGKPKTGLFFGIMWTIFLFIGHLITDGNLTPKHVLGIVLSSLVAGAVAGLLFGWVMGLFMNSKAVKQSSEIVLQTDEMVSFETSANHFKGAEGVGGRLYLTNQRLIFKSHKFNVQTHEWSINIHDILHVNRYKTLGLINNGISVTTQASTEKFVVQQPGEWLSHLTLLSNLQPLSS